MARPRKHDGVVFRRKESKVWWIRYRDRNPKGPEEPENSLAENTSASQHSLLSDLRCALDVCHAAECRRGSR
jgi:hypothetical protein